MKLTRIATIFLLSAICVAQTACKKDDDKPTQQTPTQILLSHSWKKTGYKENGVSQTIAACELDDVLTFSSNNTQTVDRGTIKCGAESQTFTDGWSLSTDNKTIIILSVIGTGELVSIDDSQFVVKRTGATTFEYIYSKK